jgi:autotransporter strand-loop-strand O-heptosyltransferase
MDYTEHEVFVIEYDYYGEWFIVHRNKIKSLLGENFYSVGKKKEDILSTIERINPDVIHLDEMPELMNNDELFDVLYNNNRPWRMIETCHNISFNPDESKKYHPDMYMFCTPYHEQTFANMDSSHVTIEFPIEKREKDKLKYQVQLGFDISKAHVLNVGLWTPGKNQSEGIEIARNYPDMQFHFVGNQAGNFMDYWKPLMNNLPSNVKVWGEREDIDSFMQAADIFMFNSIWECNPLVLREAIGYGLPIVARNLSQYMNMFSECLNPINSDLNNLDTYNYTYTNDSSIFALKHDNGYKQVLELPVKEQSIRIIQHFVDNPFLEIKGIKNVKINKVNDSASIVLAHANNNDRRNILKTCINELNSPIILSTNHSVDEETQKLCDLVVYNKENPLLFKDEFDKFGVGYYKWSIVNGEKVHEPFEFEHGYAVYTLIKKGLEVSKAMGLNKVNVINYDYQISQKTIDENSKLLDEYDLVVYKFDQTSYEEKSYCTAFFSARTDVALGFFNTFKSKEEYYTTGEPFNILEIKFYNYISINGLKVKEILFSELEKDNVTDVENAIFKKDKEFLVKFFDENNKCYYENHIDINSWVRLNREWFTNWTTKVWQKGKLIYENTLDYTNKRVFITLESKSLGDTIAWVPYALEFKKKHNCHVILSTFWNHMFDYPELEFSEPGKKVENIQGLYRVGWFYNEDKEPEVPHTIPMQKSATNILGLEYKEIKPRLKVNSVQKIKQVCIAIHSTAQAKYWNNPTGWQEVVDYLLSKGYIVKLLSREGIDYMGNIAPNGVVLHPNGSIESVMEEMLKSELFIGIGSGLSWLSWALNVPTVLISGFSEPFAEMEGCIRVSASEGKCSGCFNRHRLNAGDWNWCPDHKDTDRQFECTKSITGQMVIDKIKDKINMDLLTEIGIKYGTDKVSHQFTPFYNKFLEPIRNSVVSLLEVGVFGGASLRMWEEYFPNARIFGFDENDTSFCNTDRIKTFVANQSKIIDLHDAVVSTDCPYYDIIIDDGSHFMDDQQKTMGFLFKYLSSGGYFIMEDLHTSNFDLFPRWHNDDIKVSTLDMINALKDKKLLYQYMGTEDAEYILNNTDYVEIQEVSRGSITAIIKKK